VQRVREATAGIQRVAREDSALAAAGAILFREKDSPALEEVDSSSGGIGTAVNHAIGACAKINAATPVDDRTRNQSMPVRFVRYAAKAGVRRYR
jgi:hypothetical protein